MTRAIVLVVFVAAIAPAQAEPDNGDAHATAAAHFAEGQKHYAASEWLAAAQEFEAAYAAERDPVYLYNAAQAYRLGSACARAAEYYRRFLDVVPDPPNLEKVQRYLAELDACSKVESKAGPNDAPKPDKGDVPPIVVPTPQSRIVIDPSAGRREHRIGIAIGLGGLALVAGGAWFTHDVQTLEGYSRAICPAAPATCAWSAAKSARATDLQHRGDRAAALEVSSYALGGAALIGGIVFYLAGDRVPRERIVPVAGGALITTARAF